MNSPPGKANEQDDAIAATGGLKLSRATAQPALASPEIPDYELLRRIGGGAYGEVWLARSKATGAMRAAKIVWRHRFQDDRPFQREFEGIQRFEQISREHPSQLALFHIGRNDAEGYFYYVMELADDWGKRSGGAVEHWNEATEAQAQPSATSGVQDAASYESHTLRAELARGRPTAARVLEIGLALSEALRHLHERGLVHRDVKPSNVIFVNGRPKLADIGLVTGVGDSRSIVGTEGYLPPEGPGTPQADIFSLGKVLYEVSTGQDRRKFPDLPPDLKEWPDRQLVLELNEVVLKASAGEVGQRYASAEDLLADLARLQQGGSVQRRHAQQHRLRATRRAGSVVATLALAATVGIFLWQTIGLKFRPDVPPVNEDGAAGTRNPKAAQAYNLGLLGLRRGASEGFLRAQEAFNEAIAADPKFVAAYARLFEVYLMSDDHGIPYIDGKSNQLNRLSVTLMTLAPTNAESHAALAITRFLNEWKWNEAEREFNRALVLDPKCRMALTYYGYFLTRQRRDKEARTQLERAQGLARARSVAELALITKFLGHCEFAARRYEKALPFYEHASELEPSYPSGHYWAGRVYLAITNYSEALVELEKYEDKLPLQSYRYEEYRKALDKDGSQGYWKKLIQEVVEEGELRTGSPRLSYTLATLYARLGDKPMALSWLEKAFAEHDSMEHLLVDEVWDDYRHEQKFKDIVKLVGLTPWQW